MVSHILQVTAKAHQKRKAEAPSQQFTPVETFTTPPLEAQGRIIGNIAAGNLADGDTIPQDIRLYRELEKGNTCCASTVTLWNPPSRTAPWSS